MKRQISLMNEPHWSKNMAATDQMYFHNGRGLEMIGHNSHTLCPIITKRVIGEFKITQRCAVALQVLRDLRPTFMTSGLCLNWLSSTLTYMTCVSMNFHIHKRLFSTQVSHTFTGVDWPSGVPGLLPVGWSLMGRWIFDFFFFSPCLALVTIVTLPARGERHASARPTVLSCRHSRGEDWPSGLPV